MVAAKFSAWHHAEGWGVLESDETPGGCWVHFSAIEMDGFKSLTAGQLVTLDWEVADQDGFDFRAVVVVPHLPG